MARSLQYLVNMKTTLKKIIHIQGKTVSVKLIKALENAGYCVVVILK
jgi:hypothetical protein